jgi:hypothetical protein
MTNLSPNPQHAIPEAFNQYRRAAFERTVRLTERAIAKLDEAGRNITLEALCEASRELDEQGKGLRPITILRNPEAAELFRRHSSAYRERQQKARKAKHGRAKPKPGADVRASYRGLRAPDLIQMVEELKTQLAELKAQQAKLKAERDEAYRLRDEALLHNARQLAELRAHLPRSAPNKPG